MKSFFLLKRINVMSVHYNYRPYMNSIIIIVMNCLLWWCMGCLLWLGQVVQSNDTILFPYYGKPYASFPKIPLIILRIFGKLKKVYKSNFCKNCFKLREIWNSKVRNSNFKLRNFKCQTSKAITNQIY